MGLVVEEDVLDIGNVSCTDLRNRTHVHQHSSVSIKTEHILAWLSDGYPHSYTASMAHAANAEEVPV